MTDQSRALAASVVGAIIGGVAGYMVFTPQGRALRRRLEPALEDLGRELNHFRTTLARAGFTANEGWRLINDAISEAGSSAARTVTPHQTTPF
jgi:hypothetical protein